MGLKGNLDSIYEFLGGSEMAEDYFERHGVESQSVLTVYNDETAHLISERLAPRITGKRVVEIGGGIGILAFHLGVYASHVYCIEANPAWSWAFVGCLFMAKPKNVSYLFGAAEEFVGDIKGDIALFCTHSGVEDMKKIGQKFAPEVIDVYGEVLAADPEKFDQLAIALRPHA